MFNYYDLLYIFLLSFFIIITIIIIPNKIKNKNHTKFINSLKIGDEILTSGGVVGKIYKLLNNNYLLLMINNNQKILINKNYIRSILSKGTLNNIN